MDTLAAELAAHDRALSGRGLEVWVGGEPTFTDPSSLEPAWIGQALGSDKAQRAERLLALLARREPGGAVLRTLGRQYPREDEPRWNVGLYRRRDGVAVWSGPPSPSTLDAPPAPAAPGALEGLRGAIADRLRAEGFKVRTPGPGRLAYWAPDTSGPAAGDPRLQRPSVHEGRVPPGGAVDALAPDGIRLLLLSEVEGVLSVELPGFAEVGAYLALLALLSAAARDLALPALSLRGYPPPVDGSVAWLTVTPDPGVVEVNMAPCRSCHELLREQEAIHEAAREVGLAASRLHYNGTVADSGGGGHLTFGGPSPQDSPFLRHPQLLPRLIGYLNHHPALSYSFATGSVGAASQSPRADEGTADLFGELKLALHHLAWSSSGDSPHALWSALSPFMVDPGGNSHRAEINVEKLWNPNLPGRGTLGLVELRAFQMQRSAGRGGAQAALFRALLACLVARPDVPALRDWGPELHDRLALPFHQRVDLRGVLRDLEEAGLGLGAALSAELLDDAHLLVGEAQLGGCRLAVRQAKEAWQLVGGDVATQEVGGARRIDSSTSRLEVCLRPGSEGAEDEAQAWSLRVGSWQVPLRRCADDSGPAWVLGLRLRSYLPNPALHPSLPVLDPLHLDWSHPRHGPVRVSVHGWIPGGGGYDGLPTSAQEARRRREARFVVEPGRPGSTPADEPPPAALTPWALDLRWASPGA